jgi:hypothetical protein
LWSTKLDQSSSSEEAPGKRPTDAPCGVVPVDASAWMQIVPKSAEALSTLCELMLRPALPSLSANGVLTFCAQKGVGGAVQSAWPSQPTKFCCAWSTRVVCFDLLVFFTVNWKSATGSELLRSSRGTIGESASRLTSTGRPGMS